ncbi:MAG: twin-arginine translocation signal domain-containing protein [Pseudomonadota bacterium]
MQANRRKFLKVGALAALALAAGGGLYRATRPQGPQPRFVLDGEAHAIIGAIVPAMLAGSLPQEAAARRNAIAATTQRVHQAILGLPLHAQKEVQDLFGLLALAPARRLLAGVSGGWAGAAPEQVGAFLQDWRFHRFSMLQTAYHALHDLVIGAWYADPAAWQSIGYPGPLKELS